MPLSSLWRKFQKNRTADPSLSISSAPPPPSPQTSVNPTQPQPQSRSLAQAVQAFGMALLQNECARRPNKNVFISPLSVFLALAMVENGSAGETRAALRRALHLPPDASSATLNEEIHRVMQDLHSRPGIDLCIANALWADKNIPISPDFAAVCANYFGAVAQTLDMKDPASAAVVNNWVNEKTRGKIPEIVDRFTLQHVAILIANAVYFKGKFPIPFAKEMTRPKPFHLTGGQQKTVPMMRKEGDGAQYRSGKHCEAAVLRYSGLAHEKSHKPSDIELILVLPRKGALPQSVLDEDLSPLFRDPDDEIILHLEMPRFSMDFASQLNDSLQQMGMSPAFQHPEANLAPTSSQPLYISEVLHKTRLEVDEEGTVAAAVTEVFYELSAPEPHPPKIKTLVFDRPFAILLRDLRAGLILFAGVVHEP